MKSKRQKVPKLGGTPGCEVLGESGTAYDPTTQHLDLSKEEKRRTTALMMAIQAYRELIIKEADYLIAASDLARRNEGPAIKPATIEAMIHAAIGFDAFISGELQTKEVPDAQPAVVETHAGGAARTPVA